MEGRVGIKHNQMLMKQTPNNKEIMRLSSMNDYLSTYINNKF